MYHQYQNPFTAENFHIMYLFSLKMLSIWWPVLLVAAVGTYWVYKQEEKELAKQRLRYPARKGPQR